MSQLKFVRLKLTMIVNHAKLEPDGEGLERISSISGSQTVKEAESSILTIKDGDFTFWYAPHGYALPLAENILVKQPDGRIDVMPNTRGPNEIEPRSQLFAFYDRKNSYFYLSDSRKQGFFIELFDSVTSDLNITWDFQKIFKSAREFAETIRSVKNVILTSEKDLFNQEDYKFPLFGRMGNPLSYELKVGFDGRSKFDSFLFVLEDLISRVKSGQYKSLICIGDGEDGIERVFNAETFVEKICINVDKKEENGMYDPNEVKQAFIDRVIGMDNVTK